MDQISQPLHKARVFRSKQFTKFAQKSGISDSSLCEAFDRLEKGIADANLGGGLYKQRVARTGQGRSGGFRTIVVFRVHNRALFTYGFAKNERDNIGRYELIELRKLAKEFLTYDESKLYSLLQAGSIFQICQDQEELSQ